MTSTNKLCERTLFAAAAVTILESSENIGGCGNLRKTNTYIKERT